jgi:hypothetical protein
MLEHQATTPVNHVTLSLYFFILGEKRASSEGEDEILAAMYISWDATT